MAYFAGGHLGAQPVAIYAELARRKRTNKISPPEHRRNTIAIRAGELRMGGVTFEIAIRRGVFGGWVA